MRFQLPQFIETETKIVGPFTLKQFLWIAAGGAGVFALLAIVKGPIGIMLSIPVAAVSLALAFVKIGGVPLVNYISYAFSYLLSPKRYLFKSEESKDIQIPQQPTP